VPVEPSSDGASHGRLILVRSARTLLASQRLAAAVAGAIALWRGLTFVLIVLPLALIGGTVSQERRIEVEADGSTFVPLLPLRRRWRFPFSALGRFHVKRTSWWLRDDVAVVTAPIVDPRPTDVSGGIFARTAVEIPAVYAPARGEPALEPQELVDLLTTYWEASLRRQDLIVPK
jgi:hypothetical protein